MDINNMVREALQFMEWFVRTVQEVTDTPLSIDSTSAIVIKKGLETVQGDKSKGLINSISLERNRIEENKYLKF